MASKCIKQRNLFILHVMYRNNNGLNYRVAIVDISFVSETDDIRVSFPMIVLGSSEELS